MNIAALRFRVNDDYEALIYPVGAYEKINWENQEICILGEDFTTYTYLDDYIDDSIYIEAGLNSEPILRLIETKRYIIKLELMTNNVVELPVLQNEDNKFLKLEKDKNLITFQYINYLGRTKISFSNSGNNRILIFEVIPDKIDYENDYIELTESIAEQCSELLLEYTGSTSNLFSMSNEESKTLLEQFIFLRQFCYSDNLLSLFEAIKRNPDRLLIDDLEFKSLGSGVLSRKVFTQPFSYTKNWHKLKNDTSGEYFLPGIVGVTKKRDSLDTVANRFLKYALEKFYTICKELTEILRKSKSIKNTAQCFYEASSMQNMLDAILQDHFFDDIGQLEVLPQNNQVLQKRRGYSEFFSAFLMVDLALQLDWKGKDSIYEGESKDVALLYEYWAFFELNKIVKKIDGCKVINTKEKPFISINNNRLNISLKQGVKSCQSFVFEHLQTRVNLYYNRTFSPTDFKRTKYEGSYSRRFIPDYTIAIFPSRYYASSDNGERKALEAGDVSYIHFDAKYRISDITSIFSNQKTSNDEIVQELEEEKIEEVTNTYKYADLLKMHTYNDAIRRTIGSYVLYPGESNLSDGKDTIFKLYDEILPGVGAFAIKPSISSLSENKLEKFILRVIIENNKNYSRLNRLNYYTEMVLQEPGVNNYSNNNLNERLSEKLCVIGYIRADNPEDYYFSLEKNNLLNKGKEFYFYYYAIKGDTVYSHHKDIAKAGRFRFYKNNINDSGTYDLEPVLCEILSADLMSKHTLVDKLNKQGYSTSDKNHHADFYYVMKLKVIEDSLPLESKSVKAINHINGNDSFSPHSPKVITIDNI
jgi:conserved hypothetical protein